jgi:hypothetical protein
MRREAKPREGRQASAEQTPRAAERPTGVVLAKHYSAEGTAYGAGAGCQSVTRALPTRISACTFFAF